MPKEGSHCILLSVVLIDSVFKMGKSCYPELFLEECKYIVEVIIHITEKLEISSEEENSDEESDFGRTT